MEALFPHICISPDAFHCVVERNSLNTLFGAFHQPKNQFCILFIMFSENKNVLLEKMFAEFELELELESGR